MIPHDVAAALEGALGARPTSARPVSGGCINEACRVRVGDRDVFVKFNHQSPPGMFAAEAAGLDTLRAANALRVPAPLCWGESPAFLAMEYVASGRGDVGEALGRGLAALHRSGGGAYGFGSDNFIGSLPQDNSPHDDWPTFFAQRRLRPQLELAARTAALGRDDVRAVEALIARLPNLLPGRPAPALLHGDLWSGNYMVALDGAPVLIDPAVYRGDREAELSFTELFGGFGRSFYAAYNEAWPLDPGYGERRDLYNAYPLLVHVNLFGGGYRGQLMAAVRRYS